MTQPTFEKWCKISITLLMFLGLTSTIYLCDFTSTKNIFLDVVIPLFLVLYFFKIRDQVVRILIHLFYFHAL